MVPSQARSFEFTSVMEAINIERSLAVIEEKLKDRKCLNDLLVLAKAHPSSINRFISLAESIEADLNSKGEHGKSG